MNITAITRDEISYGFEDGYFCCMSGIEKRCFRCNMWLDIFEETGGIGYLAREDDSIIAQLIFLPKWYARRILLPTGHSSEDMDRTMSINCLYVLGGFGGTGIGSQMIRKVIDFCKDKRFVQIEACVDPRPPQQSGMGTSFFPFRKFGFEILANDESFADGSSERICSLRV